MELMRFAQQYANIDDLLVSILDVCDTFRSYLKPRFRFSQEWRAYYFTDSLLPSSLAKSKPETEFIF